MAKKAFTNNFEDIFSTTVDQPSMKDKSSNANDSSDSDDAIQRTTLLIQKSTYDSIKAIAHWERFPIKDLLENALKSVISSYSNEQLETIKKEYDKRG
ncbi:MAG: hypothetical protein RBR35_13720 [Salinivirgaceae bacterium]|nr:hypothetical protein [Salinivirgaceae bacterium]